MSRRSDQKKARRKKRRAARDQTWLPEGMGERVAEVVADLEEFDARLTELGIAHEFHRYDGCGHAFQNFYNPQGYRAAATADSMAKMFAWLGQNL